MTAKPASLDQLSNFAIDSAGHLYWNGQEVVTSLALPWWVQVATVVGSFAGLIAAVWPVVKYFLDWFRSRRSREIS
jgi:hypothetical protein